MRTNIRSLMMSFGIRLSSSLLLSPTEYISEIMQ
nr:MAG TPA: hypothetical protein [Crassvirales sp.]